MNKEFIKTIDLSKVSYIKLSSHAKSRIKQRFNVSKNNMNDWMLDLVKTGKVFDCTIADHQLRLKIISKEIIIVLDVINNTIVTVYPITIVSDSSEISEINQNDADVMNYLKAPLKQYRIFKNLDLVNDLNSQLTNMLTATVEFQNEPSLDNSNQFDLILQKIDNILSIYKLRINKLDRFFK
ncbi:hypothetical protein [Limosilactobacillus mucosae]|uniref:hypothetical protein n=1 Tax=Limosilactobacillus mucosae TaxID=97478 RepID=UPI0039932EA5